MAITPPATIQITPGYGLLMPQMVAQPLKRALENLNYLWKWHRPQLVSVCPNHDANLTRNSDYHIPVVPSVDGIKYNFETRWVCSAATQTVNVSWDYTTAYAGGATVWVNLFAGNTVSGGAGTLTRRIDTSITIPATAVALRASLSAPGAGNRNDHHLLVYPAPSAPTAGLQASGYAPFDDGLFTDANLAPVHTEWLNRCKESAAALLADRKQMAFSFVQEYRAAPRLTLNAGAGIDLKRVYPLARCFLAYQSAATLDVYAIGAVDAGTTADRISLSQPGGQTVTLDATGNIDSAQLLVNCDGGLMSFADLRFGLTAANTRTTTPYAIVAYYTPGA